MLVKLNIKNYAIIEDLEMDFSSNLNIITGETGAGKSIIAGALGLMLGDRADSSILVFKEKKCVVEGVFDVRGKSMVKDFLATNDFELTDEMVIRREIAVSGKSRAFINDTPVTLSQLNQLTSQLVDLHRQFDALEIGQSEFQRLVIDALAAHNELLDSYGIAYHNWQQLKRDCENLTGKKLQFQKEYDYNLFQFNELKDAGFLVNEIEDAELELKMLSNTEGIKSTLAKVYYELEESDSPIVSQLKNLVNQLNPFTELHPDLPQLIQRLNSVHVELQDIAGETSAINDHVNFDPVRIERLNERISLGYKLQKKHGVKSTAELMHIKDQLEEKLNAVLNLDEQIKDMEVRASEALEQVKKLAGRISKGRNDQKRSFEEKVNKLLGQVGMPNARIKVEINPVEWNEHGADHIEFLFDANAGKDPHYKPVHKVASGGELNRLMLCIKSLVAESLDLPTLVFDEIDTGISGEAAKQVGVILKSLSGKRQVICITHQPQIAGKADRHFFVYKEFVNDSVKTNIKQLSMEERITAIAKMLSGEKPTVAAIENARELVGN